MKAVLLLRPWHKILCSHDPQLEGLCCLLPSSMAECVLDLKVLPEENPFEACPPLAHRPRRFTAGSIPFQVRSKKLLVNFL